MEKIEKSDAQWKQILGDEGYRVLREAGTEPPFANAYWDNHEDGTYSCGACGLELFSSTDKYDSGTGWPSFTKTIKPDVTEVEGDETYGMVRDEVICARCGSHLGHVFPDGPEPTGERYCMNSLALKFEHA